MKVISSEIVISAVKPEQYPETELPEFALAGRSNVGKSSFINKMLNRKGLARISSKPGKTQTLNFYLNQRNSSFCRCTWLWICKGFKIGTCSMGKND